MAFGSGSTHPRPGTLGTDIFHRKIALARGIELLCSLHTLFHLIYAIFLVLEKLSKPNVPSNLLVGTPCKEYLFSD